MKDVVEERRSTYGNPQHTFPAMEEILAILRQQRLTSGRNYIEGEEAVLLQIIAKLVRREYSPENVDHYTDIAGYSKLLKELCEIKI